MVLRQVPPGSWISRKHAMKPGITSGRIVDKMDEILSVNINTGTMKSTSHWKQQGTSSREANSEIIRTWKGMATVLIILLVSLCPSGVGAATGLMIDFKLLTPVESEIVSNAQAGFETILTNHFPEKEQRYLSSDFLEKVLIGTNISIHPRGVRIKGAIFTNKLDLSNLRISHEVWLDWCVFQEDVDVHNSRFERRLTFDDSSFEKSFDGGGMNVGEQLQMTEAQFKGAVDLAGAKACELSLRSSEFLSDVYLDEVQVKGDFLAFRSEFGGKTSFEKMSIGGRLDIVNSVFKGVTTFDDSDVSQSILVLGATFLQDVSFAWVRTGGQMDFGSRSLDVPTNTWHGAEGPEWASQYTARTLTNAALPFATNFLFSPSRATNVWIIKEPVSGMFYRSTDFQDEPQRILHVASFAGDLDLSGVDVRGNLILSMAVFSGTNHTLWFNNAKIGGDVNINEIWIGGAFFGEGVRVDGAWLARWSDFTYSGSQPQFLSIDVRRHLDFYGSRFGGGAAFESLKIDGRVDFSECEIAGTNEFLISDSTIGATLFGRRLVCSAPFKAIALKIGGAVTLSDATFSNPTNFTDVNSCRVGGDFFWTKTTNACPTSFGAIEIGGEMDLTGAEFTSQQNVKNSSNELLWGMTLYDIKASQIGLANLSIATNCTFQITSLKYDSIFGAARNDKDGWEALLALYERSDFSSEDYVELERYYRKSGNESVADTVFIDREDRERRDDRGLKKLAGMSFRYLIGYGKHPANLWIVIAIFIAFGTVVFWNKKKMEQQDTEESPRIYNAFWYSFDLFLPVVKLSAADFWKPKQDYWFQRHYMRVHTLLGWCLIPLAVAAVAGLIK
ncbi:MAG: hypothetical protein JWM68_3730 [Verrucomicrobiales bacterium]|nr:hypothetical protein [Verrucomicrobiales bacterium]